MDNILENIENIMYRLSDLWIIRTIRKGLLYSLPLILIGSMAVLLINMPIPFIRDFLINIFGANWSDFLFIINDGTFGVISVTILIGTIYSVLENNPIISTESISVPISMLVIIGCYFSFIKSEDGTIISPQMAATTGLFVSLIFGIGISSLYLYFYKILYKKTKLYIYDAESTLQDSLSILPPAVATFLVVTLIKILFQKLELNSFDLNPMVNFLNKLHPLLATIIFQIITSVLWFFGIHGNNLLEPITNGYFNVNSTINATLFSSGMAPTQIATKQFLDVFVYLGGSGATLCLLFALLIKGKKSNDSRLARISFFPGLFNINEILMFGLPIVINPILFIPYILTPVILIIISYLAMATGLVPLTITDNINWTTPIILGGFYGTGSVRGSILQIINLGIGTLIYIPFIELYERHKVRKNKEILNELISEILNDSISAHNKILARKDASGVLARTIADDMRIFLEEGISPLILHMEYQPQVSIDEKVVGSEALLRANHKTFGYIPPPVIVHIANEAGLASELGNFTIKKAFTFKHECKMAGYCDLSMSINLTVPQIDNPLFVDTVIKLAKESNLEEEEYSKIEFELIETTAFTQTDKTVNILTDLNKTGFNLAIDDFGMGYGSMMYIKSFPIEKIKLDRSLTKDIVNDKSSQEIVVSIVKLCSTLGITVLAEYVETREQMEKLNKLGCNYYQGYLFSPSLKRKDFLKYKLEMNYKTLDK